jgi:MSHA pilin protein MshA
MQQQDGFTATDLAIIVTVLSMAAAFAVPRHLALNSETRAKAVQSLASNVDSSARLSNKLWRTAGYPDDITVAGQTVELKNGFPSRDSMPQLIIERDSFVYANGVWTHRDRLNNPGCAVVYAPPPVEGGGVSVYTYTSAC